MKTLLASVAAALLVVSCAPSTPQARIERNPQIFEGLAPTQRALVERGEIGKGMPKDAVWLAWGAPAQRFEGSREGRASERWDYVGARAIHHPPYFGGVGYGRFGRYGYPYSAYGFAGEVTYIPYRRASVWFLDGEVDGWERMR